MYDFIIHIVICIMEIFSIKRMIPSMVLIS